MALTPCPTCGLPRNADDADLPCPVCGRRAVDPDTPLTLDDPLARPAAEEVVELAPSGAPPESGAGRNRALVGAAVLLGAGVLTVMLWDPWAEPRTVDPYVEPPRVAAAPPASPASPPPAPVPSPPPVPEVAPPPRPYTPSRAVADPAEPAEPELAPPPRPAFAFAVAEIRVNRPNEDFHLPRIGEGNHVRLVGAVRKLTVDGVDGGAVLDASGLAAKDVSLAGKIDGGATVSVRCAGGAVSVKEKVDGRARLTIDAGPFGYVSFPNPASGSRGGSAIGGGSQVQITARTVVLVGPITGADTHVLVTLARGGSLKVRAIDGPAKVHWRQADPVAPPPKVSVETKRGNSEFKVVE